MRNLIILLTACLGGSVLAADAPQSNVSSTQTTATAATTAREGDAAQTKIKAADAAGKSATARAIPSAQAKSSLKIKQLEPRIWQCDFSTPYVPKPARFLVVLPAGVTPEKAKGEKLPVIYFLHGRGRNERTLLDKSVSARARLMASHAAIVLPQGREGWYIDSPVLPDEKYATLIDEIIALAEANFPVGGSQDKRGIGGWSMGGFGSAYTATRRPQDFAALATIIGLLDFPREPIEPKTQNYVVPPRYGTDPAVWKTMDPRLRMASIATMPKFIAYAEGAPERQMNEVFIAEANALAKAKHAPEVVVYHTTGGHSFPVVERSFPLAMDFLEKQLKAPAADPLPPEATPPPEKTAAPAKNKSE